MSSTMSSTGGNRRVSLACLPCRARHASCDAARPICSRCFATSRTCQYSESRRSGKYRARQHGVRDTFIIQSATPSPAQLLSFREAPPKEAQSEVWYDVALIESYYRCFHPSQPFVLPWAALQARLGGGTANLQQLVAIMQQIGSFYCSNNQNTDSGEDLGEWEQIDGFAVQRTLLLALMKSMCNEQTASDHFLATAVEQAKSIGMDTAAFAEMHAFADPVLAESWRRTWWVLCLTDNTLAVTRKNFETFIAEVDHDMRLPCEEEAYQAMLIPLESPSLQDYQNREYASNEKSFSSFAYLIDATRLYRFVLSSTRNLQGVASVETQCEDLDAMIASWFVMLPASKRELSNDANIPDHLMWQAHIMMYTAYIFIHRPLSNLQYDPVEVNSTCALPTPPMSPNIAGDNCSKHSKKLVQAIRKQNQCLLLLPLNTVQLSPFVICMVACGTIAYAIACNLLFSTEEVEIARSRIRVSLATLKQYESIWPRANKILGELKYISRTILKIQMAQPEPSRSVNDIYDFFLIPDELFQDIQPEASQDIAALL